MRGWDRDWGRLTKEGNRWWLGSEREVGWDNDGGVDEKDGGRRGGRGKGAWRTNMEQALGPSMLLWFVPLGRHPNDGLSFPMNPRFGREGVWRRRNEWPAELR